MIKRLCFSVLMLLFVLQTGLSQTTRKSVLMAGAATINITPQSPVPMSGYGNRDQPSKGVHDEIFARAFVFDDGKTKTCIIQADLIGFAPGFADEINMEVEKQTGIQRLYL